MFKMYIPLYVASQGNCWILIFQRRSVGYPVLVSIDIIIGVSSLKSTYTEKLKSTKGLISVKLL